MDWLSTLKKDGICQIDCPINEATLKKWNELLDPHFSKKNHEERSYATLEDLHQMGIFEEFFTPEMRAILNKVMPDPSSSVFTLPKSKARITSTLSLVRSLMVGTEISLNCQASILMIRILSVSTYTCRM